MYIQNNHPNTRIPGPSANLAKCSLSLKFTLGNDGIFTDHRGISFCIFRIGKDIINIVLKDAWNRVVTQQVANRKEWSFINDYN